jgi:type II secretion system protein H
MNSLKKRIHSGFTLIEVTIVLFIMLLMTSTTVPWMKTFAETTKLRSAARGISDLLEFARASAITERTEYAVLFDIDNGQYLLTPKSVLDETTDGTATNSSITEISQSLATSSNVNSENNTSGNTTENGSYASRTGGILGVPSQIPETLQMVELISPRSTTGGSVSTDYVVFYPDSTAEDFEVYLQGASGKIFVVNVTESTGRAGVRQINETEVQQLGLNTEQSQ